MSGGGQGYVWGWLGGVQGFIALNMHLPSMCNLYGAVCVGVWCTVSVCIHLPTALAWASIPF